ncbi:MAG: arylsulfatase [Rikenellaceae bacterium]
MNDIAKLAGLALLMGSCAGISEQSRPNVIIVLSDDQGIGNLSCLGNPYIQTPAIDRHFEQSVRLSDFHVSPLSTPTRSSIITGCYPIRNGAWATFKGRDVIAGDSPTIGEVFRDGGYSTAMFGKWHLGDNYPARATDKGFEYAVNHCSGGVGELSDHWGNNYFDDIYLVNNEPKQFEGYCTDVWFDEAIKYVEQQKGSDKPFFIYLATNAPHSPHIAPDEYTDRYTHLVDEKIIKDAGYYGQIANLDDNFARLTAALERSGQMKNTILIFTTDNGAPPANNPCTLGYRGGKSSPLEGGHRVPFFVRWDGGGINGGVDIDGLSTHVDLIPTLASLCGIEIESKFDGVDISAALTRRGAVTDDRSVFIHHRQSQDQPFDEKNSVVLRDNWRLINGRQLYDLNSDPKQKTDVAGRHPDVVKRLWADNRRFIAETKELDNYNYYIPMAVVGSDKQRLVELTIQHAMGSDKGLWMPHQIAAGIRNTNSRHVIGVERSGEYIISLTRWKRECSAPIWGVPQDRTKEQFDYIAITPSSASLSIEPYGKTIGDKSELTYTIKADDSAAKFKVSLNKGEYILDAKFLDDKGAIGAYYLYIEPA